MLLAKWLVVASLGMEKHVASLCKIVTPQDERCSISAPMSLSWCIYSVLSSPAMTLHFVVSR